MNTNSIVSNVRRTASKAALVTRKHAPTILIGTGIVGIITSTVMACKATTKAADILKEHEDQLNAIHEVAADTDETEYSETDLKRDTTIVCAHTAVKMAKLYAPAAIVGVASIGLMIGSHTIMTKRNAALAAAYTVVDKSFKDYRSRVVEKFGEELDKELRFNIKAQEIEEKTVNEDGTETVTTRVVHATDPNMYSDYARIFDDGCIGWSKDPEFNKTFLLQQQRWATERLKAKGYLFLNEVYEMLGFPRTKAGQCVGWIYNEDSPFGDNYVDFGIFNCDIPKSRDFVNGYERTIVLDFNVDGNILDML